MLADRLPDVRDALVAAGITGPHRSHRREGSIEKIHSLLDGREPDATFGLSGFERYSAGEVLGFMAEATGCSGDIEASLDDEIDPERTIAGLVQAAERLREEARRGGTLFAATGHPTGMLEFYARVMESFTDAGGKQLRLREEEQLPIGSRRALREVKYIGGVGCIADWGNLKHSHSSRAMEILLEGRPWPDLVLGDHGFAGAAIERGIPTIAVMDINDHALAIASAEGRDVVLIPMDDNRPPRLYEPAWRLIDDVLRN
jgi:hypothetical protein